MFVLYLIGYISSHIMFIIGTIRRVAYQRNLDHGCMTAGMRDYYKAKMKWHWRITFLLIAVTIYAGLNL